MIKNSKREHSFFWGGFVYLLLYSLKLKGQPGQAGDDDEDDDVVESGVEG